MDNKMRIVQEKFINENSGEKVIGLTLMVDGKIKQIFDIIVQKYGGTKTYVDIMHEIIVSGIGTIKEQLIKEEK